MYRLLLVISAALMLIGCADGGSSRPIEPTPEPEPETRSASAPRELTTLDACVGGRLGRGWVIDRGDDRLLVLAPVRVAERTEERQPDGGSTKVVDYPPEVAAVLETDDARGLERRALALERTFARFGVDGDHETLDPEPRVWLAGRVVMAVADAAKHGARFQRVLAACVGAPVAFDPPSPEPGSPIKLGSIERCVEKQAFEAWKGEVDEPDVLWVDAEVDGDVMTVTVNIEEPIADGSFLELETPTAAADVLQRLEALGVTDDIRRVDNLLFITYDGDELADVVRRCR